MKNTIPLCLLLFLFLAAMLCAGEANPSLKHVKPHPATNLRMAMGLNGPVKMVSIGSDPNDNGALEYWFDEQGYITRYYVEPDYGAYEVSLDFIYQTEEDRITQIRIVDADGKLYGLQSFEYDAAGVLTRSRYDKYEWDLWYYDAIGAIEDFCHDYCPGLSFYQGHYNLMEWDDRGNLINFRAFDQDQKYQNGLRLIYNENDKLVAVEELDAQAKVIKRSELANKHDENLVVVHDYDAKGKISGSHRYIHDLQGKPISVKNYDAQGRLQYEHSFENQYDEFGNCTFRMVGIALYHEYIYYPETPEPSWER